MIRALLLQVFLCLFVCAGSVSTLYGQHDNLTYGLKAGGTYSVIDNLETTILSEPYYLDYSLTKRWQAGFTAGGFVDYKIENSIVALGFDLMYAQQGSELYFNNSAKDFHYTMKFGYQYINFLPQIMFYPMADAGGYTTHGFYAALGLQIGLNVAPGNITYKSGGPGYLAAFGSDLEQQQQLRNVLKGQTDLGPSLGLGWKADPHAGWSIEGRFFYGLTDVVETQANSYNFIENKNPNKVFQLTLSYDFGKLSK